MCVGVRTHRCRAPLTVAVDAVDVECVSGVAAAAPAPDRVDARLVTPVRVQHTLVHVCKLGQQSGSAKWVKGQVILDTKPGHRRCAQKGTGVSEVFSRPPSQTPLNTPLHPSIPNAASHSASHTLMHTHTQHQRTPCTATCAPKPLQHHIHTHSYARTHPQMQDTPTQLAPNAHAHADTPNTHTHVPSHVRASTFSL